MNKAELRLKYLKKRTEVTVDQLDDLSLEIANKLLEIDIWDKEYYHIFLPIQGKAEVNTEYVINILAGKDKNIILPKSDFINSSLKSILLTDSTLIKPNKQGIPEPIDGIEIAPEKMDVVFVPLLAFDKIGNRLGYGKGFYDRFLKKCRPGTLKIGLSLFLAEEKITDLNEFDIPLDYCATPKTLYTFNSSFQD